MSGIERQDRIDRYLRGEMQSAEAKAFEGEMERDESLREAYEETLLLAGIIEEVGSDKEVEEAFRAASEEDVKAVLEQKRESRRTLIRTAWMAAAIFLAVVVVKLVQMPSPGSPEGVYYACFEPYPAPEEEASSRGAAAGRPETGTQAFRSALDEYRHKNYVRALAAFRLLAEESGGDTAPEIRFYEAVCLMELNRYAEAASALQLLVDDGERNPYYQPAVWYLSLASLRNGEPEKAERLLRQIVEEEGFYAEKAAKALKRLEKR